MDRYFDLNQQTYDWCVRAFDQVRKVLGIQIKMHHGHRQIDHGDIFLYNHFSRVETFIPQYLIYHETGEFCRSIAAAEFFKGSDRFANALRDLGVVPNDHPHLMELLATDILKGRKIVVFPEGGMVKDRQVVDERGLKVSVRGMKLIVPPALQFVSDRLLETTLRPGTADNDVNATRNMGMLPQGYVVNHYLTDTDAWFIKTDAPRGFIHFERMPMSTKMEGDFDTGNVRFKARERYSYGWSDPRCVFGSPGA